MSHDADLILQLWKGGVQVSKETLDIVKLEDESRSEDLSKEELNSSKDSSTKDGESLSSFNETKKDNKPDQKESKDSSYQSSDSNGFRLDSKEKSNTLDSCGSEDNSSICYPISVVEKKKHKDIFKKHCKMM